MYAVLLIAGLRILALLQPLLRTSGDRTNPGFGQTDRLGTRIRLEDPHLRNSRARFQKRSARDRLRYDPVILIGRSHSTIGSSDRENTKPNSLLPIESWHKSFTGKFRIEITWSWLNEKHQTDDIYSWRHNGRCGDVIYECRFESVMASSVHTHSVSSRYNTLWTCHIWQVCVCD